MRMLVIAATSVALAACNQSEPAPEATTEAAPAAPAPMATVANGSPAGTYEVTNPDGTVMTAMLNADGTYSDTDANGQVVEEGTWAVTGGKTCFTPSTEGAKPMCYTETPPAADGSFTATPDEGDPVMVKPKADGAAAM